MKRAEINKRLVVVELRAVQSGVLAVLLVLPAALIAADGLWLWLGIAYVGFYSAAAIIPTSVSVIVLYDVVRAMRGLPTIFLEQLAVHAIHGHRPKPEVRHPIARAWLWYTRYANPLMPLMLAVLHLAFRISPHCMMAVVKSAESSGPPKHVPMGSVIEGEADAIKEVFANAGSLAPA